MYSKLVARELEIANEIVSAVAKSIDKVAMSLQQRLALETEQLAPVDWKTVLDTLGQKLLETTGSLVEQDSEYQTQLLLEKQSRERRNIAMEKVRNQLRGARFLLDQTFGRDKASRYFPDRSDLTRVLPRNLLALARSIAQILRGVEVEWPTVDGGPHVPKQAELAAGLDLTANELEAMLNALAPERSGSVFTRGTKRAELAATRQALSSTTAALSGLFRVAGFDYAARRLRPRAQSRGKAPSEGGTLPTTPVPPATAPSPRT